MPKYLRIWTADHLVLTAGGLSGVYGVPKRQHFSGGDPQGKKASLPNVRHQQS